jgi:hypothetical protein
MPRSMLPTPSVTMTSTITGWPSNGCSSPRSITMAATIDPASASTRPSGQPSWNCTVAAKNR